MLGLEGRNITAQVERSEAWVIIKKHRVLKGRHDHVLLQKYFSSQKEHHKTVTFKEELLAMQQRAQIPYDEKYL